MNTNIFIDNCIDLAERIAEYKAKFPKTFTGMGTIKNHLQERANDPCGAVFGIEVASDWPDKCYGFEVDRVTPTATYFRFVGVWKT